MSITLNQKDNICFVYLNHGRTNPLTHEFLNRLYDCLRELEESDHIIAITLISKLPFGFSSGLDLRACFDEKDQKAFAQNVFTAVSLVYRINHLIVNSKKIYVAALSGPVIGSAASISFSCDFRIATEDTWFWLPDVQFGGLLAEGGLDLLNHIIGNSRSKMVSLTNERLNATKALEWGILYKTVSKENLEKSVWDFAKKISSLSSESLTFSKEILNAPLKDLFHEARLIEILNSESTYNRMKNYMIKPKEINSCH